MPIQSAPQPFNLPPSRLLHDPGRVKGMVVGQERAFKLSGWEQFVDWVRYFFCLAPHREKQLLDQCRKVLQQVSPPLRLTSIAPYLSPEDLAAYCFVIYPAQDNGSVRTVILFANRLLCSVTLSKEEVAQMGFFKDCSVTCDLRHVEMAAKRLAKKFEEEFPGLGFNRFDAFERFGGESGESGESGPDELGDALPIGPGVDAGYLLARCGWPRENHDDSQVAFISAPLSGSELHDRGSDSEDDKLAEAE